MKIGIEANLYRYLFKNVYFINGTAYAGKSTMVRMLSEAFDGIECGDKFLPSGHRLKIAHIRLIRGICGFPQCQMIIFTAFDTVKGFREHTDHR